MEILLSCNVTRLRANERRKSAWNLKWTPRRHYWNKFAVIINIDSPPCRLCTKSSEELDAQPRRCSLPLDSRRPCTLFSWTWFSGLQSVVLCNFITLIRIELPPWKKNQGKSSSVLRSRSLAKCLLSLHFY